MQSRACPGPAACNGSNELCFVDREQLFQQQATLHCSKGCRVRLWEMLCRERGRLQSAGVAAAPRGRGGSTAQRQRPPQLQRLRLDATAMTAAAAAGMQGRRRWAQRKGPLPSGDGHGHHNFMFFIAACWRKSTVAGLSALASCDDPGVRTRQILCQTVCSSAAFIQWRCDGTNSYSLRDLIVGAFCAPKQQHVTPAKGFVSHSECRSVRASVFCAAALHGAVPIRRLLSRASTFDEQLTLECLTSSAPHARAQLLVIWYSKLQTMPSNTGAGTVPDRGRMIAT